jgi:Protein of unknown function (DUF2971)
MSMPTTLYHYTSLEAAIAILGSKKLRASSIHYLNDATEFEYGMELLQKQCSASASAQAKRFANAIARSERTDDVSRNIKKVDPFVTSFSTNGDLLSQWRAYCRPGHGVSLGFDVGQISRAAAYNGFELRRCTYEGAEHRRLTAELFQLWHETFSGTTTSADEEKVATDFMVAFATLAATFKDESFAEEDEWRLVAVSQDIPSEVKYRQGLSFIVPFVEFKIVQESERIRLPTVVVGPSPHNKLSRRSLDHMFETFRVDCRCLGRSRAPYRAW